jgi:hypothetical protein
VIDDIFIFAFFRVFLGVVSHDFTWMTCHALI